MLKYIYRIYSFLKCKNLPKKLNDGSLSVDKEVIDNSE